MLTSSHHTSANTIAINSNNQFSSKSNLKSKISKPLISPPIRIPTPHTPLTTRRPIRLLPPYDDEAQVGFDPPPIPISRTPPSPSPLPPQTHLDTNSAPTYRSPSPTLASERPLPNPPPPAYGRWRDSIRIPDPEHTDLQQLTRELAMAEAGWSQDHNQQQHRQRQPHLWSRAHRHHHRHHRRNEHGHGSRSDLSGTGQEASDTTAPPSYSDGIVVRSDVYVVGEGARPTAPRPVLAPAPLFTGRGR